MIRVVSFLVIVALIALAGAWLVERPGDVAVTWLGYHIETSVGVALAAVVALTLVLMALWSVLRLVFRTPALFSRAMGQRRRRRGTRAISRGLVAIASGDMRQAQKLSAEAERYAADEPLTLLLTAQTAQLSGDRAAAETAFQGMAERDDTRLLGLRGLFIEAQRRGDLAAGRRHAKEAARRAPALGWAGQAVFDFSCADGDWAGALAALETNLRGGAIGRPHYLRQRAVLLTAQALDAEASDPTAAKARAFEAAKLAPTLVPAVTLAARLAAENGELRRASKLVETAWRATSHPELAEVYAHLRSGDSARDRLHRVQNLVRMRANGRDGAFAVARAALDAREFGVARAALQPLLGEPTPRLALLMAELEEAEHEDAGRARQWIARALRAPPDPCWTADGMVSDHWLPISPVTGRIDAFEWKVPLAGLSQAGAVIEGRDPFATLPPLLDRVAAARIEPPKVIAPAAPGIVEMPAAETTGRTEQAAADNVAGALPAASLPAPSVPAPSIPAASAPAASAPAAPLPTEPSQTEPLPAATAPSKPVPPESVPAAAVADEAGSATASGGARSAAAGPSIQVVGGTGAAKPPRAAPVIPLIHAPDDPGPYPDEQAESLAAEPRRAPASRP